jgi:hypothetical protein
MLCPGGAGPKCADDGGCRRRKDEHEVLRRLLHVHENSLGRRSCRAGRLLDLSRTWSCFVNKWPGRPDRRKDPSPARGRRRCHRTSIGGSVTDRTRRQSTTVAPPASSSHRNEIEKQLRTAPPYLSFRISINVRRGLSDVLARVHFEQEAVVNWYPSWRCSG